MTDASVTISRSSYVWDRVKEMISKRMVRHAASGRAEFGRFAVVPTEYIGLNVIANGLYERHQIEIIRQIVAAQGLGDTMALDIGANIGNHTVVFSKLFSEVVAFEPNPSVAALLEANVVLSRSANVRVRRVGLGTADASLPFTPDGEGNDGHGSFAVAGTATIELPVRNGDALLAEIDPDIATGERRIGFIKCDVEGFEASVFAGLGKTLATHGPTIVFESDHRGPGADALAVLKRAGYAHFYAIRETGDVTASRLRREAMRLFGRYRFWLERVDRVPPYWTNLVASKTPIAIA